MPAGQISIALSVGGAPYQARLPQVLQQRGMLKRLFRFGPTLEVLDPGAGTSLRNVRRFHEYRLANRFLWGGWRRFPGTRHSKLPQVASSWLADRLIARYIPPSTLFHGITAASLASLEMAKRLGAITVIEHPVQHPLHWQREVLAECARFGLNSRDCDVVLPEVLARRMQREYELCDAIVVPSTIVRRGFAQFSCGHKAGVVLPGVDHEFFTPAHDRPRVFRVVYVGRVELAKGVPYLLAAWHRLRPENAELVLLGAVRQEMQAMLRHYASNSIKILGFLSPSEVGIQYRNASVFVLPSVNDAFGVVMLEAMASGLPIIATDRTGADDCVADGKTGFIVPARNVDALADALLWCYRHQDEACSMGWGGRDAVLRKFTLDHYEQRQIALYRRLVNAQATAEGASSGSS